MIVELQANDVRDGHGPGVMPDWLTLAPGRAVIRGEPVGFPEIYLYHAPDLVLVGTNVAAVLDRLKGLNRAPTLSPFGVSQFLHHGLIPVPHTEWEEVWFLGIGDSAVLTATDQEIDLAFDRTYTYREGNSTGMSVASTAKLLELITSAVGRQLDAVGNEGFLMMSSGKDSVSVAIALAEAGHRQIPCITYRPDPDARENELASEICHKLGLEHRTLDFPTDRSTVEERLVEFFQNSPRPCGDFAQIPYAVAVGDSGLTAGAVLDGSGSDLYMGYAPPQESLTKQRYRIRSEPIARLVERVVPVCSPANYLTRSRAATPLPGRALRLSETKQFYPDVVDTRPWWQQISKETADFDLVDLETAVVSLFVDQAAGNLKAHVAAAAFGIEAVLPFCDPDLADYFFNLPRPDKYDLETGVRKILVRRMLLESIDYDADVVGKHYFDFKGDRFLLDHRSFVLAEISRCSLWSTSVASLAASWLDRLERRPLLYHSLLILFQLSAWHNHSRYVR